MCWLFFSFWCLFHSFDFWTILFNRCLRFFLYSFVLLPEKCEQEMEKEKESPKGNYHTRIKMLTISLKITLARLDWNSKKSLSLSTLSDKKFGTKILRCWEKNRIITKKNYWENLMLPLWWSVIQLKLASDAIQQYGETSFYNTKLLT